MMGTSLEPKKINASTINDQSLVQVFVNFLFQESKAQK